MRTINEAAHKANQGHSEGDIVHAALIRGMEDIDSMRRAKSFRLKSVLDAIFENQPVYTPAAPYRDYKRMAYILARYIDEGKDGTQDLEYHNPGHFGKVDLSIYALAVVSGIKDPERIALLVLLGTVHDFGHNGKTNNGILVDIEHRSLTRAVDIISKAMNITDEAQLDSLRAALSPIYATDVNKYPYGEEGKEISPADVMKAAYLHHCTYTVPAVVIPKAFEQQLGKLTKDPEKVEDTALLQKVQNTVFLLGADMLPSLLNLHRFEIESKNVAAESGRPRNAAGSIHFLRNIVGGHTLTLAESVILGANAVSDMITELEKSARRPTWHWPGEDRIFNHKYRY